MKVDHVVTQSAFAEALLDPARPVPAGITSHRGQADSSRFDVYRNNVLASLVGALSRIFPVTRQLVGRDFFAGMARAYVRAEPPASPLLFEYGHAFPEFVADFGPAQALAYLPDVARLELAWLSAYHARDAAALPATALGSLPTLRLGGARVAPHPAARLVTSPYPVGSIWAAHQTTSTITLDLTRAETVLVVRPAFDVSVNVLPETDAVFAVALFGGASFLEAASAAAGDARFDFGTALLGLAMLGAFETLLED